MIHSIKKGVNSKVFGDVIFLMTFILLFFVFGLNNTMFGPPQSVHIWRQTNCLSQAQNYYQDNLPLFKPQVHNQFCDDGHSGSSVGEFPIIYYGVAKLWKLFGNKEWIFRLIQLIIIFIGLFALFRGLQYFLKNIFWAAFASLLLFTSPMVVFYGPNFLPDVPALMFTFIAWYWVLKYLNNKNTALLWFSALFFCLALLLKITSALSFIALGGWIIIELLFHKKDKRIFNFKFYQILPFLITSIVVLIWYLYVEYYNGIHHGQISYHGIWPVWNMSKEQFFRIIDILDKIYFKEMFLPYTQYLTLLIWLYLVFTIKKIKPVFRYFIIVLPIGFFIQMLLWFQVLEGHDYYTINLLVVFVAIWAIFLNRIIKARFFTNPIFYGIAIAFFVLNVFTCQKQINGRYVGWMNDMYINRMKSLVEINPYFEKLGIKANDLVISLPDNTINGSLYYMNRKGYTEFGSDFSKKETFYKRIEQGAKYLIINDSTIVSREILKPFLTNKIGEYKNILIYDLQKNKLGE